jgi:hypothetical protein
LFVFVALSPNPPTAGANNAEVSTTARAAATEPGPDRRILNHRRIHPSS